MSSNFNEHDTQAANACDPHIAVPPHKGTDDIFHLCPFPDLHVNTISPLYIPSSHPPNLSEPSTSVEGFREDERLSDGDSRGAMWDIDSQVSNNYCLQYIPYELRAATAGIRYRGTSTEKLRRSLSLT